MTLCSSSAGRSRFVSGLLGSVRPRARVWAENRGSAGRVEGAPRRELPTGKTLSPRSATAEPSSPGTGRRGLGLTDHRRLTPIATRPHCRDWANWPGQQVPGAVGVADGGLVVEAAEASERVGSAGGTPAPTLQRRLWGQLHSARRPANRWIMLCRIAEFRRRCSAVRECQVAEAGDPPGLRPHGRADVQGTVRDRPRGEAAHCAAGRISQPEPDS
jgi:hypothetical protein